MIPMLIGWISGGCVALLCIQAHVSPPFTCLAAFLTGFIITTGLYRLNN